MKTEKRYIITEDRGTFTTRTYTSRPLTIAEAVNYYSYTLEKGASWSHEKGNKKINQNPKTIVSLISNLINATCNTAANGCGSCFSYELATAEQIAADGTDAPLSSAVL